MKIVLITSKESDDARRKFLSLGTEQSTECESAYAEVYVPEDYNSGEVEWKAMQLHKKHRFTHVRFKIKYS